MMNFSRTRLFYPEIIHDDPNFTSLCSFMKMKKINLLVCKK